MELYDILTLDDDKDYALLSMKEYDGNTYCLLVEVDEEENPLENVLILKKVSLGNNEFEFEQPDPDALSVITDVFKDQLLNESIED